jgi:hypothetical protein
MTYRIYYTDTPSSPTPDQRVAERTEYYTSLQAALARARELFEHIDCHLVLISCPRADRRDVSSTQGRPH